MGNYFSDGIVPVPFKADDDMTGYQFKLVMPASIAGNVATYTSEAVGGDGSPAAFGVLQNDPSAGQEASVKCLGFTKAIGRVGACDLLEGALLRAASDGLVETASVLTDIDDFFVGRWFGPRVSDNAGASVIGNVLLNFQLVGACAAGVFPKGV